METATARSRATTEHVDPVSQRPALRLVDQPLALPRTRRAEAGTLAGRAVGNRPDRLALWAVLLGLFLAGLAVATASGDGADRPEAPPPTPPPALGKSR